MPAVLFLLRAVVLVLMWGFVLAAIVTVRHDVFGVRPSTTPARSERQRPAKQPKQPKQPKSPKQSPARGARRLVVTEGALAGTTLPLGDAPITIGRADDSTLVLTDDYVSTRHARLVARGDAWVLEDLGSTNGTYLGRTKVTEPTPVSIGAPIRVGKTVLELRR